MIRLISALLFLTTLSLPIHASNQNNRNIYILKSSGVCDGCAEAISKMLFTAGIRSQILGPEQLKSSVQSSDLLIIGGGIPGGEGEWTIKKDLMKVDAFNWLKKHITNGGRYLGICAGAYLAEKWIDKETNEYGLNIFPGEIDNYSKIDKNAKYVLTKWNEQNVSRWVYFQDGPAFYPNANANIKVLATFSADETPAAVIFPSGKGKVGLISPHVEADYEWASEVHHSKDKDGRDYELGIKLVEELLE